jgi:hypothetical protein
LSLLQTPHSSRHHNHNSSNSSSQPLAGRHLGCSRVVVSR